MNPRVSRMALPVAALLVAALARGGAAQAPSPSGLEQASGLDGTNWSLAGIAGGGAAGATLGFVGDTAGGSAGCNLYSAPYAADGWTLTFGTILVTRTACDAASAAQEGSYQALLPTVAAYTIGEGTLTLTDVDGATLLTFSAIPMADVEGSWMVTGFLDDSAMVSPSASSGITVAFGPDGRTGGQGGCNDYTGPYGVSGDQIFVGPLVSTTRSCGEALDAQEQAYLDAVQQAYTWIIDGETLELRGYDDAVWVRASRTSGDGGRAQRRTHGWT